MSFASRVDFSARIRLCAVVSVGLAAFSLGNLPAVADESDGVEQAANAESDTQMSDRQRRREERRRQREEEQAERNAERTAQAVAEYAEENGIDPELVVVVEPEMECHRVVVPGSRVPKEVCNPVASQALTEQRDAEMVDRFRRNQDAARTRTVPSTNPFSTVTNQGPF